MRSHFQFRDVLYFMLTSLLTFVLSSAASAKAHPRDETPKWDISFWLAGATGEETINSLNQAQIVSAGFFLGKPVAANLGRSWWRGGLEFGFDVIPLFLPVSTQRVHGAGFEPVVLRWTSSHRPGGLQPYIELAGGGLATTANLPPGDTSSFNFLARGGGGILVFTRARQAVDLACRWEHISNANLGTQNPEFNGVQVSVGYHWFK